MGTVHDAAKASAVRSTGAVSHHPNQEPGLGKATVRRAVPAIPLTQGGSRAARTGFSAILPRSL